MWIPCTAQVGQDDAGAGSLGVRYDAGAFEFAAGVDQDDVVVRGADHGGVALADVEAA